MSDNNNGELGAFLAGFVIGGLVGAATALILAPQSGRDTRSQIVKGSDSLRRGGLDRVQQYRSVVDERTEEYRRRAGEMLEETRERAEDVSADMQEQARIVLDSGRASARKLRDEVVSAEPAESESAADAPAVESDGESPDTDS